MAVAVEWIHHASFRIQGPGAVIYVDPWKLPHANGDGDVVVVSHSHFDHCSPGDIDGCAKPAATILAPDDVVAQLGRGRALKPGQELALAGATFRAVPAYNPAKAFHPKANNWIGAVIEIDGQRIYYAGDTDLVDEMGGLAEIDLALLPVGGTYTMSASEAAQACRVIGCRAAVPYHWGDIVGSAADAQAFAEAAPCKVHLLQPGESMCL